MIVKNDGLAAVQRATPLPPPVATPAAAKNTVAAPVDTFQPATTTTAASNASKVGFTAPAGDHGKLMQEYLTGARPPPADFQQVMGYTPYLVQTENGPRMQDPYGDASSPGKIGPVEDFDVMAKTHDYGYDLLRYYAKKGAPLDASARKDADANFRSDLFAHANAKDGFVDRWKSKSWAQIFATAVELNSRRQNYGPP